MIKCHNNKRKLEEYKKFVIIIDKLKVEGKSIKEIMEILKKDYPNYNPKTIFIKYYTKFADIDNSYLLKNKISK